MEKYVHKSEYFYGNKISEYGLKHGYIDYATLAKSFDCVLVNDITKLFFATVNNEYNEIELINGIDYDENNDEYTEIYQYYIISSNGADILQELTNEIVYYLPVIDCYVWGVTHWGTSWDYVLTDIKLDWMHTEV